MKTNKLKSYEHGHNAERLAAAYLMLKGYRILKMRYKTPVGEIDIVARKKNVLVFVEVKSRRVLGDALESVTEKNRTRVTRAAQHFLSAHPGYCDLDVRFDAVVVGSALGLPFFLRHLDNAWQAGS